MASRGWAGGVMPPDFYKIAGAATAGAAELIAEQAGLKPARPFSDAEIDTKASTNRHVVLKRPDGVTVTVDVTPSSSTAGEVKITTAGGNLTGNAQNAPTNILRDRMVRVVEKGWQSSWNGASLAMNYFALF